ncbi:MAG: hypothetical protein NVSMB27_28110 [Ktedonobacteraceae bacterium]
MTNQYSTGVQQLIDAVLTTPGDTEPDLRYAIEARAAHQGGRPIYSEEGEVPSELTRFVDKVALHAYKVTDADIEALRKAGYSEDAIFEITLSAALGAGAARLERGLLALKGNQ